MKVIQTRSSYEPVFGRISVPDKRVQNLITKDLNSNQIEQLKDILIAQLNNPVEATIYSSKNSSQLRARIYCAYRLRDFKEQYKQVPILESKLNFIKRVVVKLNEYKQQLVDFGICSNKQK